MTKTWPGLGRGLACAIACAAAATIGRSASTMAQPQIEVDQDDLAGIVRGPHGPEAGVWVIAETSDLQIGRAHV